MRSAPRLDTSDTYDTIVVGAGHNALVCAAYLARAGQRVGVFERSDTLGGATATKELIPGYSFDLGASTHSFIHLTPIIHDLALDQYGLHYIDIDPLFLMPFLDGAYLTLWRSVEQTCESIARVSPVDALNYRRFCGVWTPVALLIADLMMTIPSPSRLASALAHGLATQRGWDIRRLPQLRWSIRQFLDATFTSDHVKALLGWIAAQVGMPPDAPGGAVFVVWQTIYHVCGIAFPRGGSGMLAQALARSIEAHHGAVHTGAEVGRIVVTQQHEEDLMLWYISCMLGLIAREPYRISDPNIPAGVTTLPTDPMTRALIRRYALMLVDFNCSQAFGCACSSIERALNAPHPITSSPPPASPPSASNLSSPSLPARPPPRRTRVPPKHRLRPTKTAHPASARSATSAARTGPNTTRGSRQRGESDAALASLMASTAVLLVVRDLCSFPCAPYSHLGKRHGQSSSAGVP